LGKYIDNRTLFVENKMKIGNWI